MIEENQFLNKSCDNINMTTVENQSNKAEKFTGNIQIYFILKIKMLNTISK